MEFRKSKTELKLNISTALETSCFLDTIQMLVLLGGNYGGNSFSKKPFKSLYTLLSMDMPNTNGVNQFNCVNRFRDLKQQSTSVID